MEKLHNLHNVYKRMFVSILADIYNLTVIGNGFHIDSIVDENNEPMSGDAVSGLSDNMSYVDWRFGEFGSDEIDGLELTYDGIELYEDGTILFHPTIWYDDHDADVPEERLGIWNKSEEFLQAALNELMVAYLDEKASDKDLYVSFLNRGITLS